MQKTTRKLLFYVDDDADDRMIFRDVIDGMPADVKLFESAEELLTALLVEMPDLVFMDLNMPKKDGFELLSQIWEMKSTKICP